MFAVPSELQTIRSIDPLLLIQTIKSYVKEHNSALRLKKNFGDLENKSKDKMFSNNLNS